MKKYFVIGNPIEHSLSPKLHNYWIKKNNIRAFYDKNCLDESEIKNFLEQIKQKKISGINVTVPFKKKIITYLDKLSPEAESTQSVNTIFLQKNNLVGYNTDIYGFVESMKYHSINLKDKTVLIIGGGGVVPSIINGLIELSIKILFIGLMLGLYNCIIL